MICPYTKSPTMGGSPCKDNCAFWDKDNEQCIEVTRVVHLEAIASAFQYRWKHLANPVRILKEPDM